MALLLRLIVIVLLCQIQPGFSGLGTFSQAKSVFKFVVKIGDKAKNCYELKGHAEETKEDPQELIMEKLDEMMTAIEDVANTLERFESRLDQKLDSMMDTMVDRIVTTIEKSIVLRNFQKAVGSINNLWDSFHDIRNNRKMTKRTVREFIDVATSMEGHQLMDWLHTMSSLIDKRKSTDPNGLYDVVLEYSEVYAIKTCGKGVSPQQEINRFFGIVIMSEIRGLTMAIYAYLKHGFLTRGKIEEFRPSYYYYQKCNSQCSVIDSNGCSDGSNQEEIYLFGNHTLKRIDAHYSATKVALSRASKMIRACDADNFIKEKSYAEMEGAFQSLLVREDDWSDRDSNCKGGCRDLKGWHPKSSLPGGACQGVLYNCRGYGKLIKYCRAEATSSRRYEWFVDNGGSNRACPVSVWETRKYNDKDWYDCEPCICDCVGISRRFLRKAAISVHPATSDIALNKVVTGVKLVYKNNVISLQVREGYLEPFGAIAVNLNTSNETRWVSTSDRIPLRREKEEDIYLTQWCKTISLRDISVPKGYVVAGVKFSQRNDDGTHPCIDLEVLGAQFNYSTGVLSQYQYWFKSRVSTVPIKFENPDIPLKHKVNVPRLEGNLRVDFQPSGEIDSGQSTIPFWDIQEVVTSPPSPLQGVGLLYKGHEHGKYGGYIALRLSTLDQSLYFG